ncbi:hypothetical protein Tco_1089607 [Tanacetum coccineum]
MAPLPPRAQRHLWLRYEGQGYIDEIIQDFEERLAKGQDLFTSHAWRKRRARMPSGHFVRRHAAHFGLVTEEGIWGLTMLVRELRVIDMDELVDQEGHEEGVQADPAPVQAPQTPPAAALGPRTCHRGWTSLNENECWHTDAFTTHNLAHKCNMKDHTEKIPGEFLVLILLIS